MDLEKLKAQLAALLAKAEGIVTKGLADPLTDDESKTFAELEKQIEICKGDIARVEKVLSWKSAAAKPAPDYGRFDREQKDQKTEPGIRVARVIRALTACKGDAGRAAEFAEKTFGDVEVTKALAAGIGTAGGFTVPESFSSELIDLLRPRSVVRAMGAGPLPMPNGNLTLPKMTGGATTTWVGESTAPPITQQTFGQMKLTGRKMVTIVPISNDLIRYSSQNIDMRVRNDIVASMGLAEDAAFIRGDGLGAAPKGFRYLANPANILTANPVINLQNVKNDLGRMELALEEANVPMINPGWIFAPRTKTFLQNILDANGNMAFPEVNQGLLRGRPFRTTTQVPKNLAPGTASEIYFADFSEAIIGDAIGMVIDASPDAAYQDGSTVLAAFSRDETVVRVTASVDFNIRHDYSVAVLKDVLWIP